MSSPFQEWLAGQIKQSGLSYSEIARRGGISGGRISQVIAGGENPGERFCIGIARGLNLPPTVVLEKAGILPPQPREVPEEQQALSLFRRLDRTLRGSIITTMRSLIGLPSLKERMADRLIQELDELPPEDQEKVFEAMERLRSLRRRNAPDAPVSEENDL